MGPKPRLMTLFGVHYHPVLVVLEGFLEVNSGAGVSPASTFPKAIRSAKLKLAQLKNGLLRCLLDCFWSILVLVWRQLGAIEFLYLRSLVQTQAARPIDKIVAPSPGVPKVGNGNFPVDRWVIRPFRDRISESLDSLFEFIWWRSLCSRWVGRLCWWKSQMRQPLASLSNNWENGNHPTTASHADLARCMWL